MGKQDQRKNSSAVLLATKSIAQFVIEQLLEGLIVVRVIIDDNVYEGYAHQLEFNKGNDYVYAIVDIPDPDDEEESIYVRVSIHTDGTVRIMPNQPEDD